MIIYLEVKFYKSTVVEEVPKTFRYFFLASTFYIGLLYFLPLLLIKFLINRTCVLRFEYYITITIPVLLYVYFGFRGFSYNLLNGKDCILFIDRIKEGFNEILYVIIGTIILNLLFFFIIRNGSNNLKRVNFFKIY